MLKDKSEVKLNYKIYNVTHNRIPAPLVVIWWVALVGVLVGMLIHNTQEVKGSEGSDVRDYPAVYECKDWAKTHIESNTDRYIMYELNAKDYIGTVYKVLDDHGLSRKWVWLMFAESGGKCYNESSVGAQGLWQLMSSTAKHYGCNDVTDPICNTSAAAKYITKLMRDFNNNIADVVIAYNMGGSNYKRTGKPTFAAQSLSDLVICLMVLDTELPKVTL